MIDTYGGALHRVPVDFGFSCPHRAEDGSGGCAFCPPDGSRAKQTAAAGSVEEQVRAGVAFARRRYGARRFIAYVQAFTGTHGPVEEQRALYRRVLAAHPFEAIAVGTRPDCLAPAVLDLLEELRTCLDVWVELGIQTVHDATLRRIHRGHDWATGRQAILAVHARGMRAAAHVILGLPGESARDFRETAEALAALPIFAVKIHNLHIVRNTALAEEYARDPFPVLDEQEYADALIDFLRRTPSRIAVMRINTDTPASELIAPRWAMSKGQFREFVVREMQRRGVRQGDLLGCHRGDGRV